MNENRLRPELPFGPKYGIIFGILKLFEFLDNPPTSGEIKEALVNVVKKAKTTGKSLLSKINLLPPKNFRL